MGLLPEGDHPLVVTKVSCISGKPSPQPSNVYIILPGKEQRKEPEFYSYCFIYSFKYKGTYFHIICTPNIYLKYIQIYFILHMVTTKRKEKTTLYFLRASP